MKFVVVTSVLLLVSCKTTQTFQPGSIHVKPSALIGTAYDAHTHDFTGMSCLDGTALELQDYEIVPIRELTTQSAHEMAETDLEKIFSSFQKSFYSPTIGLRLSRPYETVQRILSSDTDAAKLIVAQSQRGVFRFKTSSRSKLRLNQDAQRLVREILLASEAERSQRLDAFIQSCGTGFLAGTSYSVGIAASLRWVFKSSSEKQRWAPDFLALSPDQLSDGQRPPAEGSLRFESFMKETRDLNLMRLDTVSSRDCVIDQLAPCLDAFRLFINTTIPDYEKIVLGLAADSDLILPQAFLSDPEIVSYQEIEPALVGVQLEPELQTKDAWALVRSRFVKLQAQVFRLILRLERSQPHDEKEKSQLQSIMQEISNQSAPCYRPMMDRGLCAQNIDKLEQSFLRN